MAGAKFESGFPGLYRPSGCIEALAARQNTPDLPELVPERRESYGSRWPRWTLIRSRCACAQQLRSRQTLADFGRHHVYCLADTTVRFRPRGLGTSYHILIHVISKTRQKKRCMPRKTAAFGRGRPGSVRCAEIRLWAGGDEYPAAPARTLMQPKGGLGHSKSRALAYRVTLGAGAGGRHMYEQDDRVGNSSSVMPRCLASANAKTRLSGHDKLAFP